MFRDNNIALGVKTEATAQGTLASLAATDFLYVEAEEYELTAEEIQRNYKKAGYGSLAFVPGVRYGGIKYTTELKGSGTPGTTIAPLSASLLACGFALTSFTNGIHKIVVTAGGTGFTPGENAITATGGSGTGFVGKAIVNSAGVIVQAIVVNPGSGYTSDATLAVATGSGETLTQTRGSGLLYVPSSTATSGWTGPGTSATIIYNKGGATGYQRVLTGCVGTFDIDASVGQYGKITFNMMGKYSAPTDTSMPTSTPNSTLPAPLLGECPALLGFVPVITKYSLSMGNDIQMRQSVCEATGIHSHFIADRKVTLTMDPELELIATHDFYTKFFTPTQGLSHIQFGSTVGNVVHTTCPQTQYKIPKDNARILRCHGSLR